jgi:hypothetical protein
MKHFQIEGEWEELYTTRSLELLWRLSKGPRLLSVSIRALSRGNEVWLRQDQPDTPPFMRKLIFSDTAEREAYLEAKRMELEAEGWRDEWQS